MLIFYTRLMVRVVSTTPFDMDKQPSEVYEDVEDTPIYEPEEFEPSSVYISKPSFEMDKTIPSEIPSIAEATRMYTAEGDPKNVDIKIVQPKLLNSAEEAMGMAKRLYNEVERMNHIFMGKSPELISIHVKYTSFLTEILKNKKGLAHMNFIHRYIEQNRFLKNTVLSYESKMAALVSEAGQAYTAISDKYQSILLDFERHYTRPEYVINTAVSSLLGMGDAYKTLFQVSKNVAETNKDIRLALNKLRASSVYMFAYALSLDILFNEILPMRTRAVQNIMGIRTTGSMLSGYVDNIKNRGKSIMELLKTAQLSNADKSRISDIHSQVRLISEKGTQIFKTTASLAKNTHREAISLINTKIAAVVEVWNQQYKRPIIMSNNLIKAYRRLVTFIDKIEMEHGKIHRNKQALYTMATHCNELYQEVLRLAGLPTTGSSIGGGSAVHATKVVSDRSTSEEIPRGLPKPLVPVVKQASRELPLPPQEQVVDNELYRPVPLKRTKIGGAVSVEPQQETPKADENIYGSIDDDTASQQSDDDYEWLFYPKGQGIADMPDHSQGTDQAQTSAYGSPQKYPDNTTYDVSDDLGKVEKADDSDILKPFGNDGVLFGDIGKGHTKKEDYPLDEAKQDTPAYDEIDVLVQLNEYFSSLTGQLMNVKDFVLEHSAKDSGEELVIVSKLIMKKIILICTAYSTPMCDAAKQKP